MLLKMQKISAMKNTIKPTTIHNAISENLISISKPVKNNVANWNVAKVAYEAAIVDRVICFSQFLACTIAVSNEPPKFVKPWSIPNKIKYDFSYCNKWFTNLFAFVDKSFEATSINNTPMKIPILILVLLMKIKNMTMNGTVYIRIFL